MCHELIERLEAHLTADKFYSVIANMQGASAEEVSLRLLRNTALAGLAVSAGLSAGLALALAGWLSLALGGRMAGWMDELSRGAGWRIQRGRNEGLQHSSIRDAAVHPPHTHQHPQGPTVSPVYTLEGSAAGAAPHLFAATICVPKKQLYPAVKELRRVRRGGRGGELPARPLVRPAHRHACRPLCSQISLHCAAPD